MATERGTLLLMWRPWRGPISHSKTPCCKRRGQVGPPQADASELVGLAS